jgi:hypothetical protein
MRNKLAENFRELFYATQALHFHAQKRAEVDPVNSSAPQAAGSYLLGSIFYAK